MDFVGQQAVLTVWTALSTQVPFKVQVLYRQMNKSSAGSSNDIAALAEQCSIIHPEASGMEVCKLPLLKADLASQCTVTGVQINYSLHHW